MQCNQIEANVNLILILLLVYKDIVDLVAHKTNRAIQRSPPNYYYYSFKTTPLIGFRI